MKGIHEQGWAPGRVSRRWKFQPEFFSPGSFYLRVEPGTRKFSKLNPDPEFRVRSEFWPGWAEHSGFRKSRNPELNPGPGPESGYRNFQPGPSPEPGIPGRVGPFRRKSGPAPVPVHESFLKTFKLNSN